MAPTGLSVLWFVLILAMIPAALWFLKRTPMGGGASGGLLRTVAMLPMSPNQKVVIVEVGSGDERQWLVLGVTTHNITTLHTLSPQTGAADAPGVGGQPVPPFAQLLNRLRQPGKR
ncbi:MAG: flagellar biosis protein [Rhizobacter sp.]|nr:flagellar biosis protein [Rhizobacter sp.]